MQAGVASRTALRVAMRRAAHQLHDAQPPVLDDPLAMRILPPEAQREVRYSTPVAEHRDHSFALRATIVGRSRLAEDTLAELVAIALASGTVPPQYLVLGAGLDTFAWRNPHAGVRVFEVDHPATQAWKRGYLLAAGMDPASATAVPVDFEHGSLHRQLAVAGMDLARPVVTAWLGVTIYLSDEAFRASLRLLGSFAAGSCVVFDYAQPRDVLSAVEARGRDSLASRVAAAGEPFRLFRTPATMAGEAATAGMRVGLDMGSAEMNARYFAARADNLRTLGAGGRFCRMDVKTSACPA